MCGKLTPPPFSFFGGLGTYTFSYTPSGNTAGFNSWSMKTIVGNPDGSSDTVYMDIHQAKESDFRKATQEVYHSREMPSCLWLMVMP